MANQGGGNAAGDIEQPLLVDVAAAASTSSDLPNSTHASPIQENPNNSTGQDDDRSSEGFLAKTMSLLRTLFTTTIPDFLWSILKPLYLPQIIYSILLCFYYILRGSTDSFYYKGYPPNHYGEDDNNKGGSRIRMRRPAIRDKINRLTIVTVVRMGCLVLLWMVINLTVSYLRRVTVLGSLLWKWSLLASLILLAYPFLTCLFNKISIDILRELYKGYWGTNVEYYTDCVAEGLILALYFTSLFLAWILCVDTINPQVRRYGTLTLVSLSVGGVLSILKGAVLVWWRTELIYAKYRSKILSAGFHLYFNLLFMDQKSGHGILVDWKVHEIKNKADKQEPTDPSDNNNVTQESTDPSDNNNVTQESTDPSDNNNVTQESTDPSDHGGHVHRGKIIPIERHMLVQVASILNVHEVATHLTKNFELSLTEDDDIPDIVPQLRSVYQNNFGQDGVLLTGRFDFIKEDDNKILKELIKLEIPQGEHFFYDDFEKWMVDGLKYSYTVGNRIDGAFQVMRILSRVMTALIVVAVILIWLFITGLATTKVMVGLASVFLGLTFVFGDACTTFFQGVVFSFVTRPFAVADRCIIDDKELKVKKINILTTTFYGSQSKEIILYPNSDLATKSIMLLRSDQDLHKADFVEFSLPPQTTSVQIESLQNSIKGNLDYFESGVYRNSYNVSFMEFGNTIKMRVNFEDVLLSDGDNSEHSKSIETRRQIQRSKLVILIKRSVEGLEI